MKHRYNPHGKIRVLLLMVVVVELEEAIPKVVLVAPLQLLPVV
jgi:hypothetical protein